MWTEETDMQAEEMGGEAVIIVVAMVVVMVMVVVVGRGAITL